MSLGNLQVSLATANVNVHASTIRRLHKFNLHGRYAKKKSLFLKKKQTENIKSRLKFAFWHNVTYNVAKSPYHF